MSNVFNYGAVGDGVHDDTNAFRDALAAEDVLFVPTGIYLIQPGVVKMVRPGQVLYGPSGPVNSSLTRSARIVAKSTSNQPLIEIQEHSCRLENLFFKSAQARSGVCIEARRTSNFDDLDLSLTGCTFDGGFDKAIIAVGRGLNCLNTAFSVTNVAIERDWPNQVVTNGNAFQGDILGFRGDQIIRNRFHSCTTCVSVVGPNAINYRGAISDNMCDIGDSLFVGSGSDILISNNYVKHSSAAFLYFTDACASIIVNGNKFCGTDPSEDPSISRTAHSPSTGIQFTKPVKKFVISNNEIADIERFCLRFDDDVEFGVINGNIILNYNIALTTNGYGIWFRSNVKHVSITGNVVYGDGVHHRAAAQEPNMVFEQVRIMNNVWNRQLGSFMLRNHSHPNDKDNLLE